MSIQSRNILIEDTSMVYLILICLFKFRLLECAIECSNSKRFTQIYAALFINKMTVLAMDKSANLSVQALLKACEEKTEVCRFISVET